MLFSSAVFIFLFLPVVLFGFHLTSKIGKRTEFILLGAASLFFYGYWDARYLFVLVASIICNFCLSAWIATSAKTEKNGMGRRVAVAVGANLLLLGYFKYYFPTLAFLHSMGVSVPSWVGVTLPLGISFFTFTQIAYLVDLSQGVAKREDFVSYVLFVTFFPHLIAGPIIHHREMMPQFEERKEKGLRSDDIALGLTWFIAGLSKKVLIADRFGPIVDLLYATPSALGPTGTWIAVLCYSVQLYFDFSGYSDMAIGIARMFSIRFPVNFNSPYKAHNIIDFWARWHMTLTRYLTAYVYNPTSLWINRRRIAQGKKVSNRAVKTPGGFFNLVFVPTFGTMFLAGIWHGAGLQFIVFGMLHGIYLTVNHAWRIFALKRSAVGRLMPWPVAMVFTAAAVLVGQIFFRASSVHDALTVLSGLMLRHAGVALADAPAFSMVPSTSKFLLNPNVACCALALCFSIVWFLPNTQEIFGDKHREGEVVSETKSLSLIRWRPNVAFGLAAITMFGFCFTLLDASSSFLYFQF